MLDMDDLVPNINASARKLGLFERSMSPLPLLSVGYSSESDDSCDADAYIQNSWEIEKEWESDDSCISATSEESLNIEHLGPKAPPLTIPPSPKIQVVRSSTGRQDLGFRNKKNKKKCGGVFVFPSSSQAAKSPPISRKKAVSSSIPISPKKLNSLKKDTPNACPTINSTTKPNFLKPLTNFERKQLTNAGAGAAIIRFNKGCELPWPIDESESSNVI